MHSRKPRGGGAGGRRFVHVMDGKVSWEGEVADGGGNCSVGESWARAVNEAATQSEGQEKVGGCIPVGVEPRAAAGFDVGSGVGCFQDYPGGSVGPQVDGRDVGSVAQAEFHAGSVAGVARNRHSRKGTAARPQGRA